MTPEGKAQNTINLINNKTMYRLKNALQEMTRFNVISYKQTGSADEAFLNEFASFMTRLEKIMVTLKSKNAKKHVDNKTNYKIFKNKPKATW